jgi:hypothetical protein
MKLAFIASLLFLVGCAQHPSYSLQTEFDLMSIAFQYHAYMGEHKQHPADEEALASFQDPHSNLPANKRTSETSSKALRSGHYVVNWGTSLNGAFILAYHKDVPQHGGFVAFADGRVRELTKDEFVSFAGTAPAKSN